MRRAWPIRCNISVLLYFQIWKRMQQLCHRWSSTKFGWLLNLTYRRIEFKTSDFFIVSKIFVLKCIFLLYLEFGPQVKHTSFSIWSTCRWGFHSYKTSLMLLLYNSSPTLLCKQVSTLNYFRIHATPLICNALIFHPFLCQSKTL